jgi:hypothetical protein
MRASIFLFLFCWGFYLSAGSAAETIVFDFESGDLNQEGWTIIEGANTKPIGSRDAEFHDNSVPYDKHGKYYLTTLESAANDSPTDDPICVIESPIFILSGNEAKLLVGGGQRPLTYVALCPVNDDGSVGEPLRKAQGQNTQKLNEIVWQTSDLIGKPLVLQVVDKETGPWAHIRMDYFRADGKIDADRSALRQKFFAAEAERKVRREREERTAALERIKEYPILYVQRHQYYFDHHNTETLFQTSEISTSLFRPGSALQLWNPADDTVRTLLHVPNGVVRDPALHFDAKKVLLAIRKDIADDYHIYELQLDAVTEPITLTSIDSPADGTILKQLTFQPGVSDIDPLYLPNGKIVFGSTREPKYCMCNRHIVCNLFTMNGDGSNILQIGHSTLFEGHPSLLPDGRVMYYRWEYVDRNFGDAQGVWTTNPDGTNHAIFWGNNTASPGGVIDAKILPGATSVFLATLTSCHDHPWGAIGLIDRRLGIDGKEPILQTWPPEALDLVQEGGTDLYDRFAGLGQKFEDPFPLSETLYFASGTIGQGDIMGLWILDRDGGQTLVHVDGSGSFDPIPVVATIPPPGIAERVDLSKTTGTFYVSNVYEGFGMKNVKPGSVKFLRVVESPEKRSWTYPSYDGGTGQQAPGMAWRDFNNKRILGTVPVESDGSVQFEVPANTYVYFQLLDENGMMIQSMRSGTIIRPGEVNGCYGCHEDRLTTFPPLAGSSMAMRKPPQTLAPWYGEPRLFSYIEEVQPVLDKYCVACHDYDQNNAPNQKKPILAGDLTLIFNKSYVELWSKNLISAVGAGPVQKLEPLTWGSSKSRIVEVIRKGHPRPEIDVQRKAKGIFLDAKTDPESFDRIVTWIDINAPYYPTYYTAYPNNRFGRSPLNDEELKRLEELTGVDPQWSISFTHPERSPILATAGDKESVLTILREGAERLKQLPRGESCEFRPVDPQDVRRADKYDALQKLLEAMRQAEISGDRLYDER